MIKREMKLVITFYTTTAAMAMETKCKELGAPGRIIPVPSSISAGCGLAWCADISCEKELINLMEEYKLEYQEICKSLV